MFLVKTQVIQHGEGNLENKPKSIHFSFHFFVKEIWHVLFNKTDGLIKRNGMEFLFLNKVIGYLDLASVGQNELLESKKTSM